MQVDGTQTQVNPEGGCSSRANGHFGWQLAGCALAWLGGIAAQQQQALLWPATVYGAACAAALAIVALCWRQRRAAAPVRVTLAWMLACALACAVAGAGSTGLRAVDRLSHRLSPALEGVDLLLTGVVAALPQVNASGTRFVFEVETALQIGQGNPAGRALAVPNEVPHRVALGWYPSEREDVLPTDPRTELRAGQRWRLPVRLKRPHGLMNPHGFDSELWAWEQNLRATGSVRESAAGPAPQRVQDAVAHPIERLRQSLRDAIYRQVSDSRLAGVLAALVVGDQSAIEREDWDLFRNTGIAHLMSISGLHVTMFAWAAGLAVGWLWRRSTRLMLVVPAQMAGRWGGLAMATLYALIAGWGVPAERTLLMLACGVLLRSLGARWPWMLVLVCAAVLVTLIDPWALLQAGFWLSFAAVGLLMASEPADGHPDNALRDRFASPSNNRTGTLGNATPGNGTPGNGGPVSAATSSRWRASLGGHLRAQLIATVGLAPLSLLFFQQLSVVGLVANLIAIPWVTLVITPLAILGALVAPLWQVAAWSVQALATVLQVLASVPFAVWTVPAAPAWAVASGLLGAALAVLPLPWRLRLVALPLMLPLLVPAVSAPRDGDFDLLVADVGQGTAVLVRTRTHLLVYDTGPQYSNDSNAGQRVLVPLLRARGESRIDLLMLSHRDLDHVGGAAALLGAVKVTAISSSLEAGHPLTLRAPHQRCEDGQHWTWDGVDFEVLHPTATDYATARKPNAISCVLRVRDVSGRSALLTGDIEAMQEAALVQRRGAALASTWLLVPHHGSRTSSTSAFLDAVQPQLAWVQAGYRSRYGHPAPDVMDRYAERSIAVQRSDRCGAWQWKAGVVECERDVRRRYWHWMVPP